jgi:DNA replication protein DnaC
MADIRPEEICPHCGGTGWRLVTVDGAEVVRRCQCAEEARRHRLLDRARVPERYRHCTLASFEIWRPRGGEQHPTLARAHRAVQEYVDLFPRSDKPGLLLMGPVGSGKTHLAVAALQELIRGKGVQGLFVDFTSLVLELQMSFGTPGNAQEGLLSPLIEAELLVLDELGAGRASQWVMDLLYYVVNSRYLDGRATVFTTNYTDPSDTSDGSVESLADRVSRRIRSRLFEMCAKVELLCGDYRKHRYAHPLYEKHA